MKLFNTRMMLSFMLFVLGASATGYAGEKTGRNELIAMRNAFRSRVEEYLSVRKSGNRKFLYDMHSTRFRNEQTLEEFQLFPIGHTVGMMSYYIESLEIDGDKGTVYLVEMAFVAGLPTPKLARRLTQNWIREGDTWYKDPDMTHIDAVPRVCGNEIRPPVKESDNRDKTFTSPCGNIRRDTDTNGKPTRTPRRGCGG
jgi:hypothetical protein